MLSSHSRTDSKSPVQSPQCMWIMQALGFLLSALPRDEILGKLLSLVTPHIQQLEKLANEPVRNSRAARVPLNL